MKLKKIASLALAGVMAMSMLAGCAEGNANSTPDPQPEQPSTTSYSTVLESKLTAHAQDKIAMSDDADLTTALNYAAGFVGEDSIVNEFRDFDTVIKYVNGYMGGTTGEARDHLYDALSVSYKASSNPWDRAQTASSLIAKLNPQYTDKDAANYYKKNNVNTVLLYVVDGGVKMENVMDEIADDIDAAIIDLANTFDHDGKTNSADVNFHYEGHVATTTNTWTSGHGMRVSLVAVEIVRVIGK